MSTTLIGRLTKDPELAYTSGGAARARFSLAVTRRRKKAEEWVDETSYFDAVAWRDQAENIAESLHKGDSVIVTGRFEQRSFDGRDGNERSVVEVVADEVAPSLRWATATVNRNERRSGDGDRRPSPARSGGRGRDDSVEEPW